MSTGGEFEIPMADENEVPDVDAMAETETEATLCRYPDYSEEGGNPDGVPARGEGAEGLEKEVWDALYDVEDPEMPVSIVDLGLIYGVEIKGNKAEIDMTLTYTGCPARDMLINDVKSTVRRVKGIDEVDVGLVFTPGWSVEMVSEKGKEDLREFGLSI